MSDTATAPNEPDRPLWLPLNDLLGPLLPERDGQARTMTVTSEDDELAMGHWYSPAAVREMLAAERDPRAVVQRALLIAAMLPHNQGKMAGALNEAAMALFGKEAVNAATQVWRA